MSQAPAKRPRLSISCNWCRSHKLKCDSNQPSCSNCSRRKIECVTVDLRRPGTIGRRIEPAGRHRRRPQPSTPPEGETLSTNGTRLIAEDSNDTITSSEEPSKATLASDEVIVSPTANGASHNLANLPYNIFGQKVGPNEVHGLKDGMYIDDQASQNCFSSNLDRPPARNNENLSISPGEDLTILTDDSTERLQMMGSSSSLYILTQWLDIFFAQRPDWKPIFPYLRQGIAYTVEMPLPFPVSLPPMPSLEERNQYISIFSAKIQPIFPILDLEAFCISIKALAAKMKGDSHTLSPSDYPLLACGYALFSICTDEKDGQITELGTRYLEAAYFLQAYLLAIPYVTSVQALLLLTIVLRGRNKDGASWSALGQAIRIAQSIGLHRVIAKPTIDAVDYEASRAFTKKNNMHSRIWWTIYCLEGIMELETGRPSAIQDFECDQTLPEPEKLGSFDYFKPLIDLVKIQRQISDRLYRKKAQRRHTEQLLHDTATLDLALLDWADCLPEGIKPGRDIFWEPEQLPFATFLVLHFHQTIIALHRPALMSGSAWLHERVKLYTSGGEDRGRYRLLYSPCICASSARSIVKAMSDLIYARKHSQLITLSQVMLAMVVLGIYISRTQSSWMNESDLALLINSSEYAQKKYTQMGQHPEFIRGCIVLRNQISDHVHGLKATNALTNGTRNTAEQPLPLLEKASDDINFSNNDSDDFFADLNLDDLWPCLWGDDLNQIYSGGTELDLINTHLLGVPQTGPI